MIAAILHTSIEPHTHWMGVSSFQYGDRSQGFPEGTVQSAAGLIKMRNSGGMLLASARECRRWLATQGELPTELETLMALGDDLPRVAEQPVLHAVAPPVQARNAPAPPATDRPIEQLLVCDDAWSMSR